MARDASYSGTPSVRAVRWMSCIPFSFYLVRSIWFVDVVSQVIV